MNSQPSFPSGSKVAQRGMSLLEVLIAVLILGIGVLGIAAMQAYALRNSQSSMQQSQAVIASSSILDSVRANPTGTYNLTMACTPPSAGATVASNDLHDWITGLQTSIGPSACGSIACNGNVCTVNVQWTDSADSAQPTQTVVMQSRIQ